MIVARTLPGATGAGAGIWVARVVTALLAGCDRRPAVRPRPRCHRRVTPYRPWWYTAISGPPGRTVLGVVWAMLLVTVAACSVPAAASSPPSRPTGGQGGEGVQSVGQVGDLVVVVAAATKHEPRPSLTSRAQTELLGAAESRNVTNGPNGKSSVVRVASADGASSSSIPLTPRRQDHSVEYGGNRDQLIKNNVDQAVLAVGRVTATKPGLDLLEGMSNATRGPDTGTLIVISNGLSTEGGLDMRQVGWNADPNLLAADLFSRGLLPHLSGWRVVFTGLGETAGSEQPELSTPMRHKLGDYYMLAILVAFILLISAALVYWTAVWDGSPEQDDLAHYTRLIHHHLVRQQQLENQATELDRQIERHRRHAERARSRAYTKASVPMRTADEFITIWRTLRPQHDPVALPTIEPNSAVGAVGHHTLTARVQPDDRPVTTTFGHIQDGPLFGDHSVGNWDPDDPHLPKL